MAALVGLPLAADFGVPAHPVDLILGQPTGTSIVVSVVAYQDGDGYVEVVPAAGGAPAATGTKALAAQQGVEFPVAGLQPDTAYSYRLLWRAGTSGAYTATPSRTFRTARPAGSAFTFTLHADSHLDNNTDPALFARTMQNAAADAPDFHVDLGDTFMTDKYGAAFTDAQPQYYAQRYYLGLIGASAPVFFTLGNHDGEIGYAADGTANSIAAWSARLRLALFPNPSPDAFYTGNATPEPAVGLLRNYYSFAWGDAQIVVLDPFWPTREKGNGSDNWNWTLGAEQYAWLKRTLESSSAKLKFVFIHHLVGGFGKDRRGGAEAAGLWEWGGANADGTPGFAAHRPGWAEPLQALFVRTGVSVVFHGHDHLYVKQDLGGIVYQEVPQPGFPRADSTSSAVEYGYVTGTLYGSSGHLRVRIAEGKATVDYVRSLLPADETATRHNGDVVHSYSVAGKSVAPPPAATWILPSSARAPGQGGAFYSTDLALANTGAVDATYAVKFLGHDADGTAGDEKTFTLAAGKGVTYADVLGSVFGVGTGYGALRVTASTTAFAVSSQTWTPAGSGGTFGQSVPGFGDADLVKAGIPRSIAAVREDAAFRTNLILANAAEAPVDVDVALVSSAGAALASKRYTLPPLGMTQVTRVVRDLGVSAETAGARLVLSTPTTNGAFAAYASVIDATTNDPRTLLPR
ncbi:MAG TPA: metallophosphoesterase [Thermoanaerobaculia bacterium]|nr:metallophosphoesterase [Thermoanaerobaculia bacterium]